MKTTHMMAFSKKRDTMETTSRPRSTLAGLGVLTLSLALVGLPSLVRAQEEVPEGFKSQGASRATSGRTN